MSLKQLKNTKKNYGRLTVLPVVQTRKVEIIKVMLSLKLSFCPKKFCILTLVAKDRHTTFWRKSTIFQGKFGG